MMETAPYGRRRTVLESSSDFLVLQNVFPTTEYGLRCALALRCLFCVTAWSALRSIGNRALGSSLQLTGFPAVTPVASIQFYFEGCETFFPHREGDETSARSQRSVGPKPEARTAESGGGPGYWG